MGLHLSFLPHTGFSRLADTSLLTRAIQYLHWINWCSDLFVALCDETEPYLQHTNC